MDRYPPREVGIVMSVLLSFGLCCLSISLGVEIFRLPRLIHIKAI
jgi:hypothetical protein